MKMHFNKISELFQLEGFPPPQNPLFSLRTHEKLPDVLKDLEISCDFYMICFKKLRSGEIWYGKTRYDHSLGFMYFIKPGQILAVHDVQFREEAFTIYFHEDYLLGHPLFTEIKKYIFFDYEINEAVHLSPKEEEIMWSLFHKMETEHSNNPDEFSTSIILSHIDSLLRYAQRFYKRQFVDRKVLSGLTVTKFNESLNEYFTDEHLEEKGLPTVNFMASQLHLSPKYLSDLLKQETGKTALELIHLSVISKAKNMLVAGEHSISEIAYRLGFENPPYFSRLFRKEVGMSPREYKNRL